MNANERTEVYIFPGEHSYYEALELLRNRNFHSDMLVWHRGDGRELKNLIAEGMLPVGDYWVPNGCDPGDDSLEFFGVRSHHAASNPGWVEGVCHKNAKLKVAVFVSHD